MQLFLFWICSHTCINRHGQKMAPFAKTRNVALENQTKNPKHTVNTQIKMSHNNHGFMATLGYLHSRYVATYVNVRKHIST